MILASRRWSRSCMIFLRLQRCRRFEFLPDFRYPRYTREIFVRENQNSSSTSEMICPISRAPTIAPRSNSLKSLLPAIVAAVTYRMRLGRLDFSGSWNLGRLLRSISGYRLGMILQSL
ncbi:uncharacterized protein TNCV_3235481 [Trichonephila clavipes]|nr:uncharacterized protein TNCV_3235481 [Trichonephila clavipes]